MAQIELSQMCSSCREEFAFALRFDKQLQKRGRGHCHSRIMVSFGTAGLAGRHQLLCTSSPESDCRVECVQIQGRYRESA